MKKLYKLLILSIFLAGCTLTTKPYIEKDKTISITQQTKLNLSNQNLSKIPNEIFEKKYLEELDISHNKLTGSLQAEIRHLENLRVLIMSNNNFTGVPAEIGQLSKLEILDLSNNQITGLPYELGNLKNLKTLNISGNKYSKQDLELIEKNLPDDVNIIK